MPPSRTRTQAVPISLLSISNEIEPAGNACAREKSPHPKAQPTKAEFFRDRWRAGFAALYPERHRAPFIRSIDRLGLDELSFEEIERRVRRYFEDPEAYCVGHPVGWLVAGWETNYAEPSERERLSSVVLPSLVEPCLDGDQAPEAVSAVVEAPSQSEDAKHPRRGAWKRTPAFDGDLRKLLTDSDYDELVNGASLDGRVWTTTAAALTVLGMVQDYGRILANYVDVVERDGVQLAVRQAGRLEPTAALDALLRSKRAIKAEVAA